VVTANGIGPIEGAWGEAIRGRVDARSFATLGKKPSIQING
jgi:hypothetical protein